MREKIVIPNQGHTVACLIRRALFQNNASFASCIVSHPQDTNLNVEIEHSDPKKCLLMALRDAREEIETCLRTVNRHMVSAENGQDEQTMGPTQVSV